MQAKGSIEAMMADVWALKISKKQQAALLGFKNQVGLMRRLVTLRNDVEEVWDALR